MKTYYLTLSQVFPATHPRKGQPTLFKYKLMAAINKDGEWNYPKLHTIRANYELWRKRFEQIERGEACLSVRQWTGKPYASKQEEIARLTIEDGIGLQKLEFFPQNVYCPTIRYGLCHVVPPRELIAHNDGLSHLDWVDWFLHYNLSKPFAIIHFTKFRY